MALTVMEMVAKLGLDDDEFQKGALGVNKSAKTMGDHIKRGAAIAATAITGGLVVAAKIGWDAFQTGQVIALQTETVLKSTGNAANTSAEQIKNLAVELQNKSGVDDQVIRSGENLLATFQNVRNEVGAGNDIFVQGTKAALDFSAATGKDMNSSVRAVGRALNDPIKGLSLLTRQGINFTDQEKAQIQTMVDHNNIIGAQKLVLDKLNTTYGGSADISSTVAGKMAIARERFKDTAETLVGALLPAFLAILGPIASMGEFMSKHTTTTKVLVAALVTLVPVLYAISLATRLWTAAQVLLNIAMSANPIGIIIVGLVALGVALVVAYKKFETFRNIVNGVFNFIKAHWLIMLGALTGGLIPVIVIIIQNFRKIKDVFLTVAGAVLEGVIKILGGFATMMHALGKMPGPMGAPFRAAADAIDAAIAKVQALQSNLNALHSKTIHVNAIVSGLGYVAALQEHIALLQSRTVSVGARRQHGGPVSRGSSYLVGERGPELFVPRMSGSIVPNNRLAAAGGGTVNNFYGPVYAEERYLEDMLQRLDEKRWKRNG